MFDILPFYEKYDVIIFMKVKKKTYSGISQRSVAGTGSSEAAQAELERLGKELRDLRKAHNYTLQEMAELSGKSVSFLSKIERGLARPSVTALQDIAAVLNVPIGWFFQSDGPAPADERPYIVRANRRRRLRYSDVASTDYMGFEDHLLSANLDGQLALGMSRYIPGGSSGDEVYTHEGEEAGLVLEGTVQLTLGDRDFQLETGDSFSFSASIPHTYLNTGDVDAVIIWANTPITLGSGH
ncbi:MAG: cupin domain-containing protein [Pseudomonadota bacterium]